MMREFTCIICPNGCEIQVRQSSITGAACPRGEEYVRQELTDPRRNIATSVLVEGWRTALSQRAPDQSHPQGNDF